MKLNTILQQITDCSGTIEIEIPASWHQGRTAYGGLSAALAYHAATLAADQLPPLCSAQIAFIGPLAGKISVKTKLLRRGRSTAFIQSDIWAGDELGLRCLFIFKSPRDSQIEHVPPADTSLPPVPSAGESRSGPPEFFTGHLDYPAKRLDLSVTTNELANWHRLKDYGSIDPFTELLCIGDALPPSAMGLMDKSGPVSSMNWQINMLADAPATHDGWWYLSSNTHHAKNGTSSQYMTVRNTDGVAVMSAMQSVALFV